MRENKFRGKRLDNGEWIYGSLIMMNKVASIVSNDLVSHPGWQRFDVETKSVGQYTGLKDKNGVEIYDGDIVEVRDGDDRLDVSDCGIGVIEFIPHDCWYISMQINNGLADINIEYYIEVIDNIHENKELLS